MHQQADAFPSAESLAAALHQFVIRARRRTLLRRALQGLIVFAAGLLAAALLHRWLALPSVLREILFDALLAVALGRPLPALARWLSRHTDPVKAALQIERFHPQLHQQLSTWASCRKRSEPSALFDRLDQSLRLTLRQTALADSLPRWPVRLAALSATMGGLCMWLGHDLVPLLPPWR